MNPNVDSRDHMIYWSKNWSWLNKELNYEHYITSLECEIDDQEINLKVYQYVKSIKQVFEAIKCTGT